MTPRDDILAGYRGRVDAIEPVPSDLVPAGAASVDAVRDLLARTDDESGGDAALVSRDDAAAFNAIGTPDRGFIFYARAGARLVGYGRLDRGQSEAATLGVVALTVLAAYRRKGLGEALMRALLGAAANEGVGEVWLAVRPDNTPALRLYEKLGFARDACHPLGHLALPDELTMVWYPTGRGSRE
ncbi:MAG TPA: GNAT family N-acetyltransferase [Stellaceae bacterium]|nr:GNAT family N-acetyltransferase [Stellaceae bacterium]